MCVCLSLSLSPHPTHLYLHVFACLFYYLLSTPDQYDFVYSCSALIVLHCTVLYCTVLYCIVLTYAVVCCAGSDRNGDHGEQPRHAAADEGPDGQHEVSKEESWEE